MVVLKKERFVRELTFSSGDDRYIYHVYSSKITGEISWYTCGDIFDTKEHKRAIFGFQTKIRPTINRILKYCNLQCFTSNGLKTYDTGD